MSVDAATRDEAVAKMKEMMTQKALDDHIAQYHKPEEPKPTLQMAHAQIEQGLHEDVAVAMN